MDTEEFKYCASCKTLQNVSNYKINKGKHLKCFISCLEKSKKIKENMQCIHQKQKSYCKECGGSQICIHNKYKPHCKECGGVAICIHDRRRSQCKDCSGSQICIHNKRGAECRECNGSSICIHNKNESRCKECGGSEICLHYKRKTYCKECSPHLVLVNLVRIQVYRTFKNSNLKRLIIQLNTLDVILKH